jgi:hypothetical protein
MQKYASIMIINGMLIFIQLMHKLGKGNIDILIQHIVIK